MGSKITPLIFFMYTVFLLQHLHATKGNRNNQPRLRPDKENKNPDDHDDRQKPLLLQKDPELNVFFRYDSLKLDKTMPLYFPQKNPSNSPQFLSRQESDSIPFSTSQFPHILKLFSYSETSKQALAMWTTLQHCESQPIRGETRFCATSLESMLDSVRDVFGSSSRFRVIGTSRLPEAISSAPLQNYTVIEPPVKISARRMVACHVLPYPYAVFYCHGRDGGGDELYRVLLAGDGGGRVEAAGVCHMDTTEWDPRHVAFRVLETGPGGPPVCHFFPADSLVWITQ